MFVVRGLKNNLLGLPAIQALQLVQRVDTIRTGEDIREQFPKVFTGLGTLGEPYQIKLKEGALPYSIYAPRAVPIPLRDKVKAELRRMEEMGSYHRLETPPHGAGMVVVPKRSGAIRICVDLKPLNQCVAGCTSDTKRAKPLPSLQGLQCSAN